VVPERLPVLPPTETHYHGGEDAAVPQEMPAPRLPEVVDVEVGPSLVTGCRVASLASSLHPAIDRVRLNANDWLVGIALVRECSNGTGEFFRDRRLPIFPALCVVVPHAEEAVGGVRKVVAGDAGDLFATDPGLNAKSERDLLLGRLRLVDERCDRIVLVTLAEPDPLPVSFAVVVESYSRLSK
jgi:hypothetical protein